MPQIKQLDRDDTATYDQSGAAWTDGDAFRRIKGIDLVGVQVNSDCANYNGATIGARLQGTNQGSDASPPTSSSVWFDIDEVTFTANGNQRMGGSSGLVATQGYRFLRFVGNVNAGSPSADVTLTFNLNADYED
jgi:hypothetical protein